VIDATRESDIVLQLTCPDRRYCPGLAAECARFLKSQVFCDYIKQISSLTPLDCYFEMQGFGQGHYTVIHDDDYTKQISSLDVVLTLLGAPFSADPLHPVPSATGERNGEDEDDQDQEEVGDRVWDEEWGGLTIYMDGDETLASTEPAANALSLLFRDSGCNKFVRRINHWAEASFYALALNYRVEEEGNEVNDDELAELERKAAEEQEQEEEQDGDAAAAVEAEAAETDK
jgi:hypothetical protein